MDASSLQWLLYANVVTWVGLGAYLLFLLGRQKDLCRRLDQYQLLKGKE